MSKENQNKKILLEVKNLKTHFPTSRGPIKAVDSVDFRISEGEILGIVGESGSGKSMTSLSIMRLLAEPGEIVEGEIIFEGEDITKLPEKEMRNIRGNKISMIFQEPMTSLNPVFKVGMQIEEVLMLHQKLNKKEARLKAIEMLDVVGISRPEEIVNDYPFQLSGGMRQRVMIAIALACNPKLLIADEPTTALDVTIQAQILSLMNDLKDKTDTAIILITHDLGVVAQMADHIIVMYSGKIVEDASTLDLFKNPKHPYTQGLIASIPDLKNNQERLETIEGNVPNPLYLPKGCHFAPRCKYVMDICKNELPELRKYDKERKHKVRCFLIEEGGKTNE